MAKDDFDVIVCKLLAYLMACMKAGVEPSTDKARELAGCNDLYWGAVVDDLAELGYVKADIVRAYGGRTIVLNMRITMLGAGYLADNEAMAKVKKALGAVLSGAVEAAVAATSLV